MTAAVSLRAITDANRTAILALDVAPHQRNWVDSNEVSLRQAEKNTEGRPENYAVYADEQPVGFLMIGCSPINKGERPDWFVSRLMIDVMHQRRGYGRAAMRQIIDHIRAKPDCHELRICFEPANKPARALYTSLGFVDHGEIYHDEVLLRMPIRENSE